VYFGCFRVADSIQENTQRILNECESYVNTVKAEEDKVCRIKAIHSTIHTNQSIPTSNDGAAHLHPLLTEIQSLEEDCQTSYQNNETLNEAINHEQSNNPSETTMLHNLNTLELSNATYRDTTRKLISEYQSSQYELQLLSNDISLFDLMFHIKSGKYDMINGLRVGFRPRKDLEWEEIHSAWSLAAQMLMFVGGKILIFGC